MRKKRTLCVMCFLLMFLLFPITAHADTGPKASIQITFENMGDEVCYGTLLSSTSSTGPSSAWDGNPEHIRNDNMDMDIWQAFVDYEDSDGYYFLQEGWLCSESKQPMSSCSAVAVPHGFPTRGQLLTLLQPILFLSLAV